SKGSLEASAPGQRGWLEEQLGRAHEPSPGASPVAVVVVTSRPLYSPPGREEARDAEEVAALLVDPKWGGEVRAVFTTDGVRQLDERNLIPREPPSGAHQIPEYEGASLGYQQPGNNGVMWYFVSVDTSHAGEGVQVDAIPVIDSLALKPVDGL